MKKTLSVLALLVVLSTAADAFTFDDIQFWVGSGSNQAALVIDWNDGKNPVSLAWGYRWDGAKKGIDLLNAIAQADSRLYVHESDPGGYGVALFGVGYDIDADGFATSPALTFNNGISVGNPNDSRMAADAQDHYKEGWMSAGYWSYYLKSSSTANWSYSGVGMSGRTLTNGCWDGWSWAPNFSSSAPSEPVPATNVPEPGSLAALMTGILSLGGLVVRRQSS